MKISNLIVRFSIGTAFRVVPVFLFFVLAIFIGLDIYLTWIGTPDLKYETNILINTFNLGWFEIVLFSIIYVFILIVFGSKANNYFIQNKKHTKGLQFGLNSLLVIIFYSQFFSSLFAIFNNYFSYIYLFNSNCDALNEFANIFVGFYQKIIYWYLTVAFSCCIFLGILVSVMRIRKSSQLQ